MLDEMLKRPPHTRDVENDLKVAEIEASWSPLVCNHHLVIGGLIYLAHCGV